MPNGSLLKQYLPSGVIKVVIRALFFKNYCYCVSGDDPMQTKEITMLIPIDIFLGEVVHFRKGCQYFWS